MKCFRCNQTAEIELDHFPGPLCILCFCELIEKRVRRYVRQNDFFARNDNICIVEGASYNFTVTKHLLESILKFLPKKMIIGKHKDCKTVIPWNLDLELQEKLGSMFGTSEKTNGIKLLSVVLQKEVKLFAEVRHLGGEEPEPVNKDVKVMLDSIEKEHPDIKFAMLSAFSETNL